MALRSLSFVGLLVLAALLSAEAAPVLRHRAPIEAFRKTHPCPATGKVGGPCHGFVVDHIRPLCFGGADAPENMAWQAYAESLKKDAFEREACALLRRCHR